VIGYLEGTLLELSQESVLMKVGGVGYEVLLPFSHRAHLSPIGSFCHLFIHTYVREDAIKLFGFYSLKERTIFEHLVTVSGVGPKLALALLGTMTGEDVAGLICAGRSGDLVAIPGVGRKIAERLILELKDKLHKFTVVSLPTIDQPVTQDGRVQDLRSALNNLGYKDKDIAPIIKDFERAIQQCAMDGSALPTLEGGVRDALKRLTSHVFNS